MHEALCRSFGTTLDILHGERRAADHSANIGSKGRRVFRGAEDLRLIRGHLFRRVAQGRNAGKIAATRGLATEVCQTSITFGHAWPISPGRRMAALVKGFGCRPRRSYWRGLWGAGV